MDYTSNSHKSKETEVKRDALSKEPMKKVVNGDTRLKERSVAQGFISDFLMGDIHRVTDYLINDVALPAFKKFVDDMVTDGIHMMLYGDPSKKKTGSGARASYTDYYDRKDNGTRSNISSRREQDYRDVTFQSRGDAERVLQELRYRISKYQVATISDLYDAADISTNDWTTNNHGWINLDSAEVVRTYDGWYTIKLPRAVPID